MADLPRHAEKRGGPAARDAVEHLLVLLRELHSAAEGKKPIEVLQDVLQRTGYAVWLARQTDGPARLQNVESLHALLEHATAPDLATWLADLHLAETETPPDQQAVALLTVHSAKG